MKVLNQQMKWRGRFSLWPQEEHELIALGGYGFVVTQVDC